MSERPLEARDIRRICAGVRFTGLLLPLSWLMKNLLALSDTSLLADVLRHARDQFGIARITVDEDNNTIILHYEKK
ncbi:hypothetical protein FJY93_02320 [Candidatus Kaiserbacteria bacterium]|nr:hypothetical protein [Candidatus Kaiserbacteria bacterium]